MKGRRVRPATARLLGLAAVLLVARSLALPAQSGAGRSTRHLELTEVASLLLPRDLAIAGGVLVGEDSALIWTPTSVWRLLGFIGAPSQLCGDRTLRPVYARRDDAHKGLQLLDSLTGSVIRVGVDGSCEQELAHVFDPRSGVVASIGEDWMQVHMPRAHRPYVRVVSGHHVIVDTIKVESGKRLGDAGQYTTRAASEEALLGEKVFPFRVWRLGKDWDMTVRIEPERSFTTANRFDADKWTALMPLKIDNAYLIVLADRTSDWRRIQLYSTAGELLSERVVDVAMGFLDANRKYHRLLAVRNIGRPELVLYKWRWRAGSHLGEGL